MDPFNQSNARTRKFTNFADHDQLVHHRYRDNSSTEHNELMLGEVRRMSIYFDRL